MRFITVRLTVIYNRSKGTVSACGGLGLLQMVSEPDTKRCVGEDIGPPSGWIVRSHIDWRGERNSLYKGVKTSP